MEPVVMVSGSPDSAQSICVRVHDQCFTSEVFGSLKCDCKEQLNFSKLYIKEHGGVIIYLQQEGRGIGLANKISAYSLQEKVLPCLHLVRL
jgi:GTP cyclohydrolase II